MMPFPSLKSCHRMCGPTSEPKLTPHLSPAINSSNPDALESRGRPNHGLADVHFSPRPRVLPQQVGHAEVLPGGVRHLLGPRTSRPLEGPINGFPDAPVHPHQVGVAEVVPGEAQNLPGPCTSELRVRPPSNGGLQMTWGSLDCNGSLYLRA